MSDREFYHALYMLVTHCAAIVAALAILINIGLVWSIAREQLNPARILLLVSVGFAVAAAVLFCWRAYTYASIVNRMLNPAYIEEIHRLYPGPGIFALAGVATIVLAVLILKLLLFPKQPTTKSA